MIYPSTFADISIISLNLTFSSHQTDLLCSPDVQTLSRMTGKDFSGPTPEIRAPTPVRLDIVAHGSEDQGSRPQEVAKKKKVKRAPSVAEEGVEVLGNLSDIDDEEFPDRPF